MWVWILAVVALVAIWVGGYWILDHFGHGLSLLAAIILTVLVVLAVVGWFLFKRWRAIMKARALEREIMKQAEQQAMNARPDRRAEIIELQMQVQRGLAALKSSRLGGMSGSAALYQLPWYVIIGPPGAGKTTALKASGLSFPFQDQQGGGVRGIGGTRNCDWWFTNEAILLDTAGRYTTEADDHEEWLAFLGMLKRYRSRKPINGVLVAIAVSDLMEATEEQIDSYAKKVRARIDEVMTRLQMVVPVYVLFTKTDLVAGFVEFWNDLRKSERGQIWGATFPLAGSETREPARAFETEFDGLVEQVHARAIKRIGAERQWEARQKIFQFPIEYQALRTNLSEFINGLFQRNNFQETPIFRGVYFTSGTQEGRPIDRVIGGMMRAFNIAPAPTAQQPQGESKSYFVTDVFRKVVFPDQYVAARTKGELRRQLINRLAIAAVALFLAAIVLFPSLYTYYQNTKLVDSTRAIAAQAKAANWDQKTLAFTDDPAHPDPLMALDAMGQRVRDLDKWQSIFSRPAELSWGMYTGNDLFPPTRDAYVADLDNAFAKRTRAAIEADLKTLPSRTINDETYSVYFAELKAYLEACGVRNDKGDIALEVDRTGDGKEPGWETQQLTAIWRRTLNVCDGTNCDRPRDDRGADRYDRMAAHVEYYLTLMKKGPKDGGIPWWTQDPSIVGPAQTALKKISRKERVYAAITGAASKANPPITRESIFPPDKDFSQFISSQRDGRGVGVIVPGAFTHDGWARGDSAVRRAFGSNLINNFQADLWVLELTKEEQDQAKKQEEQDIKDLKNQYFQEYIQRWHDFLADLKVESPQDNLHALKELQALSTLPLPYVQLFKAIHDNTVLEPEPPSLSDKGKSLLGELEDAGAQSVKSKVPGGNVIFGDGGAPPPPKPEKTIVEQQYEPLASFGYAPPPAKEGDQPTPTPLDAYQSQVVTKLVGDLTDLNESKGKGMDAKQVTSDFVDALHKTTELLTNSHQTGFTNPLLSPLLRNPIELGYQGVLNSLGGVAGGKWEPEVWKKWNLQLDNHYPFTDSVKDASLQDFTTFFKPNGGLLWGFYDANLKDNLEKTGTFDATTQFQPSVRFNSSIGFTPDFMRCYNRGLQITSDTFPNPKADAPLIEFDINLHSVSENVSEVTFGIDGTEKTYQNTPEEWVHVQWPAKEPKARGGVVRIRGFDGLDESIERPGDFGFFRLMDAAISIEAGTEGGRRNGAPTVVVTWPLRSQNGVVRMDIKPSSSDSIFQYWIQNHQRVFRGYWCPRVIAIPVR